MRFLLTSISDHRLTVSHYFQVSFSLAGQRPPQILQDKSKLSLCLNKDHIMKAQKSGGKVPLILLFFYVRVTVHRNKFLDNKTKRMH